jgi:hypothetical protein
MAEALLSTEVGALADCWLTLADVAIPVRPVLETQSVNPD